MRTRRVPLLALAIVLLLSVACQAALAPTQPTTAPGQPQSPTAGSSAGAQTPSTSQSGAPKPTQAATGACGQSDGAVESQRGNEERIRVNQLGYRPEAPKLAFVAAGDASTFKLIELPSGRTVCGGKLGAPVVDEDSLDRVQVADFSNVQTPGTYAVVVPGVGRSYEFRIAEDVYTKLYKDAMTSYDALAKLAPEEFQRTEAIIKNGGGKLDVGGGWPDAGDYGRYMPTAAATVGKLLLSWELLPDKVGKLPLGLSKTSEPEYLKIVRVPLDWMLKLQREDGAVYHKVTPEQFGPFSKDGSALGGQQFVYDVSTADTALFAAATAKAARAYQPHDPAFAERLRSAAERAWGFLEKNPKPKLPPASGGTGAYVYADDAAQRFWAAAELFRTTGKKQPYEAAFLDYWNKPSSDRKIEPFSWLHPQSLGMITYYYSDGADGKVQADIKRKLVTWADQMATWISSPLNGYRVSLSNYAWASNKTALDNATLLLVANQIEPKRPYVESALDQLHYVLGRNTLGKVFVTGYGGNPVKNPHNRAMFAAGKIVPGVLVGGPNSAAQDGQVKAGEGPRSYADKTEAYSVNENSIEYNAPLVFVTAYFSAA